MGVHFNLRYSKLKSDYQKVIKSGYVMGVVQYHFYQVFLVQYVTLSFSTDIDDFAMTYGNVLNALEI